MFNHPYFMPYPMQGGGGNTIEDIKKTMDFLDGLRKAQEDKDKKKDSTPKKNGGDVIMTAMFFTFLTPFIMLLYGWAMTNMLMSVLEALAKIKGIH